MKIQEGNFGRRENVGLGLSIFVFIFAATFFSGGCAVVDTIEFFTLEGPPDTSEIFTGYYEIELTVSNSADVLSTIYLPEHELLSQSKSVVASWGEKKRRGYMSWFKMAGFDEDELKVSRKYVFVEDERPKRLFVEPWPDAKFDCAVMLDSNVLEEPYSDDNIRRIAILRQVLDDFKGDISEVRGDNKKLAELGMMVNQAFEAVLAKLDNWPALAKSLSDKQGIEFEHMSMDKGKIRLVVVDDIAQVRIRMGSCTSSLSDDDMLVPDSYPVVVDVNN